MGRIDYLDDPNAPQPNSLVPSANVVVDDGRDRLLLIQRSDNGKWALPGGAMDLGERPHVRCLLAELEICTCGTNLQA